MCSSGAGKILPPSESKEKLGNDFASFFMEKIERVKNKWDNLPSVFTQNETSLSESQLYVSLAFLRSLFAKL